jgi:hypothetical protein
MVRSVCVAGGERSMSTVYACSKVVDDALPNRDSRQPTRFCSAKLSRRFGVIGNARDTRFGH